MGEHQKVGTADDRSPIWPEGFVGSLSHSDAWVWGCVARQTDLVSIGIDTELVASTELRQDVQDTIATAAEWNLVSQFSLTADEAFTLVFSAKEAFYKCWYPLIETYFDFFDVEVVALTPSTLSLKTLPTHPGYRTGPGALNVHYSIFDSSVFTATWMKAGDK
jgi:enterobactin synthetase component D